LEEFREAFRLFDRVSSLDCFQLLICFSWKKVSVRLTKYIGGDHF
jgi:hypothetical protein